MDMNANQMLAKLRAKKVIYRLMVLTAPQVLFCNGIVAVAQHNGATFALLDAEKVLAVVPFLSLGAAALLAAGLIFGSANDKKIQALESSNDTVST